MNVIGMKCPHCGTMATARTSKELSRTLREVKYQCRDIECGHTWMATLEAVRTLSPSGKPDPEIEAALPYTPRPLYAMRPRP
ncbi:ogr/Delta-like zinc finger family protein [Achromobacter sp. SD115]|uniref:ogr/Delta-like zinc finger family protein n=1 Tax=Achromobacter sp. SD115 TaxID=2782011 RepID=UPI001A956818|nr:ogr/Delta-like zinc finger family protein [Achromobacter sp. SD115]MBO1014040.1 ogr/Delta-like zinc finger family protein [Achromobacter sp. SD115]